VIGYLRRLMDIHGGKLEREFSQVWNALADSALNLHPGDLLADLDRAYGEGLVDPGYVSLREIVRQAKHPVAEVLQRSRKASLGLVTDAIAEIKRWPAFAAPERPVSPPKPDRLLANASRQPRPVAVPSRPGSANHFGAPPLSDAALTSFFAPGVPIHAEPKTGRNDPCPCGSGRKYKRCCEGKS
jgi:hypothetical protein